MCIRDRGRTRGAIEIVDLVAMGIPPNAPTPQMAPGADVPAQPLLGPHRLREVYAQVIGRGARNMSPPMKSVGQPPRQTSPDSVATATVR